MVIYGADFVFAELLQIQSFRMKGEIWSNNILINLEKQISLFGRNDLFSNCISNNR